MHTGLRKKQRERHGNHVADYQTHSHMHLDFYGNFNQGVFHELLLWQDSLEGATRINDQNSSSKSSSTLGK